MIRKTSSGYKVLSEKGKNLGGPYKTGTQRLLGDLLQTAPCRSWSQAADNRKHD